MLQKLYQAVLQCLIKTPKVSIENDDALPIELLVGVELRMIRPIYSLAILIRVGEENMAKRGKNLFDFCFLLFVASRQVL